MAKKNTYDADSIAVLEGLEAVRKRPGMYIGSVSTKGLNHLVYEIVDNAVDEHLAGYCDTIDVYLEKDGSATIEDNGRGMSEATLATILESLKNDEGEIFASEEFGSPATHFSVLKINSIIIYVYISEMPYKAAEAAQNAAEGLRPVQSRGKERKFQHAQTFYGLLQVARLDAGGGHGRQFDDLRHRSGVPHHQQQHAQRLHPQPPHPRRGVGRYSANGPVPAAVCTAVFCAVSGPHDRHQHGRAPAHDLRCGDPAGAGRLRGRGSGAGGAVRLRGGQRAGGAGRGSERRGHRAGRRPQQPHGHR